MSGIRIENVSLRYRAHSGQSVSVLSELSLEIAEGELLSVLGPSGAGKTSLLRLIGGLEVPSQGKVYLGDQDVHAIRPGERSIYYLAQDGLLYPSLTSYQNLSLVLERRNVPPEDIRKRVEGAAQQFGLEARLEAMPETLSRGERQRVCLARALLAEQRVLLLDEPLSGVDPERHFFLKQEILAAWTRTGATVVYVTHDPREAFTLGGRVAIMEAGRLQQVDAAESVFRAPANRFVASFIDYPPMNFLAGSLSRETGKIVFCCRGEDDQEGALRIEVGPVDPAWLGRPLVMGIRPDDLKLGVSSDTSEGIEAEIERTEVFAGSHVYVLRCGGSQLIVREAGTRVGPLTGVVRVQIPPAQVVWFDGESNERLD